MKGISVLIACYNSEKVIATTLLHLQKQKNTEGIDWEVILVDNKSTDDTSKIAKETWDKNPIVPLTLLWEERVGLIYARKTSILAAKYDTLCIVDDDNWMEEHWIKKVSRYFEDSEIGIVGCAGEGEFESPTPWWFNENQNAFAIGKLYDGDFVDVTPDSLVPGAGMCIRKNVYDFLFSLDWQPLLQGRVGSKQSAGDDSELCYIARLLGFKIFYSNQLKFKHFTADTRISWERLCNMTQGFGESDVFTLPYKILYTEKTKGKSLLLSLRKKWWFNYFGKKIALLLKDPFQFIAPPPYSQKELNRIRNKAFCETIWVESKKFENSFAYLENISSGKTRQ